MTDELESWVAPVRRGARSGPAIRPEEMHEPVKRSAVVTSIWFDPGVKTGWSVFTVWREAMERADYPILGNVLSWSAGWFTGTEFEITNQMVDLVEAWDEGAHVGYEDFTIRKLGGRELLSSPRIAARFQDRMDVAGRRVETPQMPSLAMTTVTDDRLRRWGFWASLPGTDNSHARDAVAHNITWLKRAKEAWDAEKENG